MASPPPLIVTPTLLNESRLLWRSSSLGANDDRPHPHLQHGNIRQRGDVRWQLSDRADPVARKIADRHYNRQSIGHPNFVPPGRCVVLRTTIGDAFWVTSWPYAEYVKHDWAGAWMCSAFRNESEHLSSELITEALAATLWVWPEPPDLGMVTFVNTTKVRRKRDWGRCYLRAGFQNVGYTKGGLVALQLLPEEMPEACPALDTQEAMLV